MLAVWRHRESVMLGQGYNFDIGCASLLGGGVRLYPITTYECGSVPPSQCPSATGVAHSPTVSTTLEGARRRSVLKEFGEGPQGLIRESGFANAPSRRCVVRCRRSLFKY